MLKPVNPIVLGIRRKPKKKWRIDIVVTFLNNSVGMMQHIMLYLPWMTPIPIPAIPSPLRIYKANKAPTLVTTPVLIIISGIQKTLSITMVFKIIRRFPNLLLSLRLKYSFTLARNVLAKSDRSVLENFNFLITVMFYWYRARFHSNVDTIEKGFSITQ